MRLEYTDLHAYISSRRRSEAARAWISEVDLYLSYLAAQLKFVILRLPYPAPRTIVFYSSWLPPTETCKRLQPSFTLHASATHTPLPWEEQNSGYEKGSRSLLPNAFQRTGFLGFHFRCIYAAQNCLTLVLHFRVTRKNVPLPIENRNTHTQISNRVYLSVQLVYRGGASSMRGVYVFV
jgi:hypothetical protein